MALAAQKVDNKKILEAGVKGLEIAKAIKKKRIKNIKRYLKEVVI